MKSYKIREGFTFVESEGERKQGGETIQLADDVAQAHLHKLELIEDETEADAAGAAVPKTQESKGGKKAAKDAGQASLDDSQPPATDAATNG